MSTADAALGAGTTGRRFNLAPVQKFGRSLMLPIAALPVAGLLLRLGQPDLLGADGLGWVKVASVVGAAGNGLFANLPILFAVGIAIGMAKKSDGSTALAAVVGYLVFKSVGDAMSPFVLDAPAEGAEQELINFGVLGGIVMGLVSAYLWQRYHRISLPPYLAFFGGRRFVPIITAFAAVVISVLMSFVYQYFDSGITNLGEWVTDNDVIGGFVYGTLNRLLIPLGLHHILNNPPWFFFGSYTPSGGEEVHGDIYRFLARRPDGGAFMTGFFPIMMFALPAAALAIWHEATAGAQEGRRRHHALRRALLVPDRCDRAARVRVHVRRVAALHPPRRADRHVTRAGQRAGHQGRVRVLGGPVRLRAELQHRDQTAVADRDRARLRSHLLLLVPVRDPMVEPQDAGSRGRG